MYNIHTQQRLKSSVGVFNSYNMNNKIYDKHDYKKQTNNLTFILL